MYLYSRRSYESGLCFQRERKRKGKRKRKRKRRRTRSIIEEEETHRKQKNIEIVNFLTSDTLAKAINSVDFVIARSGYTTIMDLAALHKKAFFIPTPGQAEQEYLAKRLKEKGIL